MYRAARWREASADQVEQRRVAGAVWAYHRVSLAARDAKRHAANDRRRTETLVEAAQFERSRRCFDFRGFGDDVHRAVTVTPASVAARCHAAATIGQVLRRTMNPAETITTAASHGHGVAASTLTQN